MDDLTAILSGEAEPPKFPPGLEPGDLLVVSRRVLAGAPALFAWRDEPTDEDSGWTLLAGDEPDEWLQDPDQFVERTAGDVLAADPTLLAILGAPPDSTYERTGQDAEWVELVEG